METHVRQLLGLVTRLKRGKRLLGIDFGEKRIGLALSDVSLTIASPLETLKRGRFHDDALRFSAIVGRHDIGALVIGLPLHMGGDAGARAQATRSFAHRLGASLQLPFFLWDERLSTRAVEHVLREMGGAAKRREALTDRLAATHILQGALDCARNVRSAQGRGRRGICTFRQPGV